MSAASSTSSSASGRRSCRVCSDDEDLFAQMRSKLYSQTLTDDKRPPRAKRAANTAHNTQPPSAPPAPPRSASGASTSPPASSPSSSSSSASSSSSFLAAGRPLPCPPDGRRLGRASWTLLHSVAAFYPAAASAETQQAALSLLQSLPRLYPCPHCAQHLSEYYEKHKPEQAVSGKERLGLFLCAAHNDVRQLQGKRLFDCSRWKERWGGDDWEEQHSDKQPCDDREYGDVEDEETDKSG